MKLYTIAAAVLLGLASGVSLTSDMQRMCDLDCLLHRHVEEDWMTYDKDGDGELDMV